MFQNFDSTGIIKTQPKISFSSASNKIKHAFENTLDLKDQIQRDIFNKPQISELSGRELLEQANSISISYGRSHDERAKSCCQSCCWDTQ